MDPVGHGNIVIFWVCPFVLFTTMFGIRFCEAEAELAENRMRLEDLFIEVVFCCFC